MATLAADPDPPGKPHELTPCGDGNPLSAEQDSPVKQTAGDGAHMISNSEAFIQGAKMRHKTSRSPTTPRVCDGDAP